MKRRKESVCVTATVGLRQTFAITANAFREFEPGKCPILFTVYVTTLGNFSSLQQRHVCKYKVKIEDKTELNA